jgi:NAD(P)-dependent dehydrogenase (short-subunit alcohol dehydrogenase family)
VVISARSADQLAEVAHQVEAAGRRALVIPADLSDLDTAAGLAGAAVAEFGRLDIVVNNVGGAMPRPFPATKPRHLEAAFHFNVAVAHALTQAAVPHLLAAAEAGETGSEAGERGAAAEGAGTGERDTGTGTEQGGVGPAPASAVINIFSTVGRTAGRGYLAYGTAKAALSHYTRLAAAYLAPRIRVNGIAVGAAATSALDIVLTDDRLRRWSRRLRLAGSVTRGRSPPRWSSSPPRHPAISPERFSRWTAELSVLIPTSAFPTFR